MPANTTGTWGSLFNWPLIGIHSVMTQDGKVLSFGTDLNGNQGSMMYHDVWDPITNTHQTIDHHNHTSTDIFCANAIIVPGTDNILIGGGDTRPLGYINNGVADVNNYNTNTNQITPDSHGDMANARWYATSINLANGQILQLGGLNGSGQTVKTPELYTPGEGWKTLTGATDQTASANYDRAFVRYDGKVVYFNGSGNVMLLDATGNGSVSKIGTLPFGYNWESSAVQYSAGKILVNDSGSGLWSMDINGGTPTFTKVGDLGQQRNFGSMTVLANGTVLINGGSTVTNTDSTAVKTAMIWNPATNSLTSVGAEAVPRLYHSTSLLLTDGSVLSMGGGSFGNGVSPTMANQQNGQIYKPTYLFDANGNPATRPTVVDVPDHVQSGTTFTMQVGNAADITKLTLVKTGAVTHDFDMNSGFANLSFTVGPNNTLIVTLPGLQQGITAGSWMLFAWNSAGVPAIAPVIEIDPVFNTGAAVDAANILTNGSLETAASLPNGWAILDAVVGWESSKNNFEVWKSGTNGVTAKDGATFMEVDAERGTLSQDVHTKAGQTYDLTFDLAGRAGSIASSVVEVLWNGVVVGTIAPTDATFKAYSIRVTGTGGNDVLGFRSPAADTDSVGGLLDHVMLKAATVVAPFSLISNSNMESQTIPNQGLWVGLTNAQSTGWKNTGADNVVLVNHMGSQMLDLDPEGAADELYQMVQTKSAQAYTLSFDAIATIAGTSAFDVLWNGVKIATVDPSTTALQRFTFTVTGTGGLDKLSFRELASQNDYLGSYLDNVRLVEGAVTPPTVNLISNANMQSQTIPNQGLWVGLTNAQSTGWKNTGADNVVLVNHMGSQMLDLDPEGAADELYQLVQTKAAQGYTLGFDAVGTAAGTSSFEVLWNGVVVATINPSLTSLQHFTFKVTGTGGLDKLAFRELASQNDYLGAYLDNVSLIESVTAQAALHADGHDGNHMLGTAIRDVLNGTIGTDHVKADAGNDVINTAGGNDVIEAGLGNDLINASFGADEIDGGGGFDTVTFRTATSGVTVDLQRGEGSRGDAMGDVYTSIENIIGTDFDDIVVLGDGGGRVQGLGGDDKLIGGASADQLSGGHGKDIINGMKGADTLSGGFLSDRFLFALGDSGQTIVRADTITDLSKGSRGDVIDFNVALSVGGSAGAASAGQASINDSTGVASFAAGSGETMHDAINDIARRFTAAGDVAGEFALFQLGGTGDHYLFVSDGVAGVTADDVVIRLQGIANIGSLNLDGGDLNVLT